MPDAVFETSLYSALFWLYHTGQASILVILYAVSLNDFISYCHSNLWMENTVSKTI